MPADARLLLSSVDGGDELPAAVHAAARSTLRLLQAYLAADRLDHTTLAVLTHGAQAVIGREPVAGLAQSAVPGLVRAAQAEHPGRILLVDTDDAPASRDALPAALGCGEPEVAIRAGRLYAPRLVPVDDAGRLTPPAAGAWRLDVTRKGTLDNLALLPHPEAEAPLGPRQVRISVRAAGLNFRDIAVGLELVASERTMGSEGAGVVIETGPGCTGVAVGDRVFGVFERSLGPVAVADERMIAPMPRTGRSPKRPACRSCSSPPTSA